MIVAVDGHGRRIPATHINAHEASCPECGERVIPKNGEIVRPHFAHRPGSPCVLANTGESTWHREWKWLLMNAGWDIEVPIGDHRADAARLGQVVEIQRRPLDRETVYERGYEYGAGLIWIINAINSSRVKINAARREIVGFGNSLIWLSGCDRPVVIDCGAKAYLVSNVSDRWYTNDDGGQVRYAAATIIESFSRVVMGTSRTFPQLVERLAKRAAAFGPSLWDRARADLWLERGRRLRIDDPMMRLRYTPIITLEEAA